MAGARLEAHYPVSVITDGMGLNITVMSYMGHLDVGIVADRDQMPDVERLMEWLPEELAGLTPCRHPARAGRRGGAAARGPGAWAATIWPGRCDASARARAPSAARTRPGTR